jgi:hypothetical protein
MLNVGLWHLADNPAAPMFGRFRTTADKGGFWPAEVCPLLTQSEHSRSQPNVPKYSRFSNCSYTKWGTGPLPSLWPLFKSRVALIEMMICLSLARNRSL